MRRWTCILVLFQAAFHAPAAVLRIDGGSLHEAVRRAGNGDTLLISGGPYMVEHLVIDKPLSLVGVGMPLIDGGHKGYVLSVESDGCLVKGLRIARSGRSDREEYAAIRLLDVSGCVIDSNLLEENYFGVYLANTKRCVIRRNTIRSHAVRESFSGNGIHLWKCERITITRNDIRGHRDGIYIEFGNNSFVVGNHSENNLRYGLHFMFSDSSSYNYNTFIHNGTGVAVMYTRNVTMSHNVFSRNQGSNSYGLLLKDISHSYINDNHFRNNTSGLYMEGSNDLVVERNTFAGNGSAIRLLGNCFNDTLRLNNFHGNTFDMTTNAQTNMNHISHNYWDHYKGYDLDRDGKGDVPYYPVSLYSKVTEEYPASLILLHSFFTNILNEIEHLVPTLVPDQFADPFPLVHPAPL